MVMVLLVVVCFRPARVVQRLGQRGLRGLAVQKEGEGPQAGQELDQAMVRPQERQHVLLQEQRGGYTRRPSAAPPGRLVGTPGVLLLHHQADWWVHPASFCCTTRQTGGPQ